MAVSRDDLVTALLIYLLIGSLVWFLLYASGITAMVAARRVARGLAVTPGGQVIAIAMVILAWPITGGAFLAGLIVGIWQVVRR